MGIGDWGLGIGDCQEGSGISALCGRTRRRGDGASCQG